EGTGRPAEGRLCRRDPSTEISHPRRSLQPRARKVPQCRGDGVEKRPEDAGTGLLEITPEVPLVASTPVLDGRKPKHNGPVGKIRTGHEVVDPVDDDGTRTREQFFLRVRVEPARSEASARR